MQYKIIYIPEDSFLLGFDTVLLLGV